LFTLAVPNETSLFRRACSADSYTNSGASVRTNFPDSTSSTKSSRSVFSNLTVKENLKIVYREKKGDFQERIKSVFSTFPELERAYDRSSASLSGGEGQMLAIACSLVNRAELLVLDEPSEDLSPLAVTKVMQALNTLEQETTILLVEQNFNAAKLVGDTCYFMDKGQITYKTNMEELKKYLGVSF
jgi:branched-chain amino acid transport system ATP-binding protein